MKSRLKFILLVLVFVLPVATYIFLKLFGNNQFIVPVYHQDHNQELSDNCDISFPYQIDPLFLTDLNDSKFDTKDFYFMVVIDDLISKGAFNELRRLKKFTENKDGHVVSVKLDNLNLEYYDKTAIEINEAKMDHLKNCILLINNTDDKIVLIDKQQKIRGYYPLSRAGIDRSKMELDILLKNY
ncbi:MAG TPA: hypothetical protein ACFCUD_07935 [Cyclobacteriaceae bacterium]